MDKKLIDEKGVMHIENIQRALLEPLVKKMEKNDSGYTVCRQFAYDRQYMMLVIDVFSQMASTKVIVTVALWTNENDASSYVTRKIPYYIKEENLHVWEDFCEEVSGGKAIFENHLLGNFFIGHIEKNKVYFDKKPTFFENLVVDKFVGRLDVDKAREILGNSITEQKSLVKKTSPKIANLLEDEEEDEE